ncbi:Natural killer cell receptor 2B4 [Myotis brandtii]|uniref:Natural killer cell receptor 2B4 n=1 Tax=Myotis brandtii TaxID=109478 RepID=S7PZZ3_MYOBR|nr:Natural killer cell receptor 2B4 [Myotis brandtii]
MLSLAPFLPAATSSCPVPLSPDGPVVRPSGTAFCLGPGHTPTAVRSFDWKVQRFSNPSPRVLFTWKNDSRLHHAHRNASDYNRLNFSIKELRLLLTAAQPDDSGTYSLEVTLENGTVRTHRFHVSVLDPVGKPELQLLEQTAALGSGKCRVTLNCSASGGGDVTYTWYRGGEWIPTPRSPFRLEEQIDANGWHIYTCNVSNPVSWAHQSLQLSQGCGSAPQSECSAWGWDRAEGAGPSPGSGAGDGRTPLGLEPFPRVLASRHTGPGQPGRSEAGRNFVPIKNLLEDSIFLP